MWRELGRVDEALVDFDALVEADPADGEALLNRALVRQESGFNPRAVSSVGAMGLMQLMMPTARELWREEKKTPLTPEALMDPERNVRLGLRYLGRMLRALMMRS